MDDVKKSEAVRNGGGVYLPEAYRVGPRDFRCKRCDTKVDRNDAAHLVVEVRGEVMCVEVHPVSRSAEHLSQLDAVCDALAQIQTRPGCQTWIRGVM